MCCTAEGWCIKTGWWRKRDEAERETNKGERGRCGQEKEGCVRKQTKLLRLWDEAKKDEGRWKRSFFHPQLICPVAAEPEYRDALMNKNTSLSSWLRVCFSVCGSNCTQQGMRVFSLILQDVVCARCMHSNPPVRQLSYYMSTLLSSNCCVLYP